MAFNGAAFNRLSRNHWTSMHTNDEMTIDDKKEHNDTFYGFMFTYVVYFYVFNYNTPRLCVFSAFPVPIVIAIASVGEYTTVILKATSGKISRMCWITNSYIHYIVNIGYYALVFVFTTGIFITILTRIVQARNIKATDGKRKTFRKQLMMVLSLFLLFGLTWSVAFFSYGPMLIPSYYIFTVLNSLQGEKQSHAAVSGNHVSTKAEFAVADDHLLCSVPDKNSSNNVKVNIQVNSTDQCFWNTSSSTVPGICAVDLGVTCKNATYKPSTCKDLILAKNLFRPVFFDPSVSARCKQHSAGSGNIDFYHFYRLRHLHVFPGCCFIHAFPATVEYLKLLHSAVISGLVFVAKFMFVCFNRKGKSNQATKILMNMFVALSLLNVSFLSNESVANTGDNAACVFIALLLHYSMLASFTWFFIQALHMYLWLIRQNVSITNYMRKITVLGWGDFFNYNTPRLCVFSAFPAPIVIAIASVGEYTTVILKTTSGKISRMCWITNPFIHYTVNIGYYALVFIFTTGIFITILTRIVQARRLRATDGKRKTFRKQLMMVLSLFLLFGLTWSVAFFSYGPMRIPSYYIFTVLNSLQGFFLFLYYYHIHNDAAGSFSDDPRSSGSTTTMVQPNINGLGNVYK
ncbi:hypothetical protein cypCar_00040728 [Cyprinus carpio]|nr:hypothetical protein cypCar_00040728 [Cyprinus carpio]